MSIVESFKLALSSIWKHKVRSILTMLGVIIGIAAVIIIVAIGQGAKTKMTEELFATEENAVDLWYEPIPVEGQDESEMSWEEPVLTSEDVEVLSKVPGVKAVIATNQGWGPMVYEDKQGEMQITGVGPEFFTARNIQVVEGRPINSRDTDGLNRVIMVDTKARKNFSKIKQILLVKLLT